MYKKVLFTTDGSKFAEESLPYAADLAKQGGAELEVLTVIENPVFYGTPEATALYDAEFYRSLAAYRTSLLGGNSTMVMSPDSEFFDYLRSSSAPPSIKSAIVSPLPSH